MRLYVKTEKYKYAASFLNYFQKLALPLLERHPEYDVLVPYLVNKDLTKVSELSNLYNVLNTLKLGDNYQDTLAHNQYLLIVLLSNTVLAVLKPHLEHSKGFVNTNQAALNSKKTVLNNINELIDNIKKTDGYDKETLRAKLVRDLRMIHTALQSQGEKFHIAMTKQLSFKLIEFCKQKISSQPGLQTVNMMLNSYSTCAKYCTNEERVQLSNLLKLSQLDDDNSIKKQVLNIMLDKIKVKAKADHDPNVDSTPFDMRAT